MRINARIDLVATAIEPIHHGAGSSGNTQMLRTQEIILPDGSGARVPFISGNSIKHMIRESGARFALAAMQIKEHSLTKAVTDLLFSGGALTKVGSSVNLEQGRKLESLFPLLSLCGYSAGNCMVQSKLRINNLHLVCAENAWRVPSSVKKLPVISKRAGLMRGEEFGTRHESSRMPYVAKMLVHSEHARLQTQASSKDKKTKPDTAQMIYDYQTIKAGSSLWGSMILDDVSESEQIAFKSALSSACEGIAPDGGALFSVGAKSNIGHGLISIKFDGTIQNLIQYAESSDLPDITRLDSDTADLNNYAAHLFKNADEIIDSMTRIMG